MNQPVTLIDIPSALVHAIRGQPRVTVLTGAGVSAESGIPTFRDAQTGLWAHFRPEELASPQAFEKSPDLVWKWYTWRRSLIAQAAPNAGHTALAEMERRLPSFSLVTQNVDGLHQKAGSQHVIELHGNLSHTRCSQEHTLVERWEENQGLPSCPSCGALLRPDVVWFGEALPAGQLEQAIQAARSCDWFFSIGTSGLVEPAASLPYEALRHGAKVVEINPLPTPLSIYAAYLFQAPAGQVLTSLVHALWAQEPGMQV
jgi:NAD-dependent deacetylase